MTTLNFEQTTLQAGNYVAIIMLRDNLSKYPLCPYMVRTKLLTPKGKYQSEKILKQIVFKTELEAKIYAEKYINKIQANLDTRAAEKQTIKEKNESVKASDFYKINDIVVNTWGWEQTNVDFYKVIKVGNKTISVVSVCSEMVENSEYGMSCKVIPTLVEYNKESRNLRVYAEGKLSNPETYHYFTKWDGTPQYKSWYA